MAALSGSRVKIADLLSIIPDSLKSRVGLTVNAESAVPADTASGGPSISAPPGTRIQQVRVQNAEVETSFTTGEDMTGWAD